VKRRLIRDVDQENGEQSREWRENWGEFEDATIRFDDDFAPTSVEVEILPEDSKLLEDPFIRFEWYGEHLLNLVDKYFEDAVALGCPRVPYLTPLGLGRLTSDHLFQVSTIVEVLACKFPENSVEFLKIQFYYRWIMAVAALSSGRPMAKFTNPILIAGAVARQIELTEQNKTDALRGKKTLRAAESGGAIRKSQTRNRTESVLKQMVRYINRGHSQTNAARLAFKKGLGSSGGANRQLWQRHIRK